MRIAALDLGSNTSLMLIADVTDDGRLTVVHDESRVTKMGQGVHASGMLHPEALERLDVCLADYASLMAKHQVQKCVAVATSAARDVRNQSELLALGKKHGVPIHIISGDKEAQLTFRGALCDRANDDEIAVIDVGGGSTEMIVKTNGRIQGRSVDVGSVRLSEMFVTGHPIPSGDLEKVRLYAQKAFLKSEVPQSGFREVVAVAGTPTTLAAIEQAQEFRDELVHGFALDLATIDRWIEKLAAMTVQERERLTGMQPKRADVIVTGSMILASAMRYLGQTSVTVSTRGVRYGVALAWQTF